MLLHVVAQIRQLLFPGVPNMKAEKGKLELQRTFKVSLLPSPHPLLHSLHGHGR